MLQLNYVRILARLWFTGMVLLGLSMVFYVANSNAATIPPTETRMEQTPPSGPGPQTPLGTESLPNSEQPLIDMSAEVAKRAADQGGQYIFGREDEVIGLDEKLGLSDSHTVVVQGESGNGRTGLVEEWTRRHPEDKVYRLNIRHLALMGEVDATQALKKILIRLEQENIDAAKLNKRVVLFVDNLPGLLQGNIMQPIQALWESVVRKANLYTILESDAQTARTQITEGKYPALRNLIEVHTVKPGTYDAVVARLMGEKARLERSGLSISTSAVEDAARIAVRYRRNNAFKFGAQLMEAAAKLISNDQRAGSLNQDRLKAEVRQLETLKTSLTADLTAETDADERTRLQKRLAQIESDIASKSADESRLTSPTDTRKTIAQLEIELVNLNNELEDVRKTQNAGSSWSDRLLGKGKPAAPRGGRTEQELTQLIREKTIVLDSKSLDLTAGEDTGGKPATRMTPKQVRAVASKWLNIPPERLDANFNEGVRRIDEIKKVIFGQDHVIEQLKQRLMVNVTHLQEGREIRPAEAQDILRGIVDDSMRPVGSFFFAGPTGTGKTETTIQLAQKLGYELIRLDMSEFQQEHYVSRLIGSPPGYVGSNQPGELLDKVEKNPESVVLFDEIEKAHPRVMDALIQILDAGRLSEAVGGRTVDFRKTMIIITSNLAQEIARWDRGQMIEFLKTTGRMSDAQIAPYIRDMNQLRAETFRVYVKDPALAARDNRTPLRPELVERIDALLMFERITQENAVRISQKTVENFINRMKVLYKIDVRFSPDSIVELMRYFNAEGGGRSLRRAFDNLFRAPVAELVGQERLTPGDTLLIGVDEQSNLDLIRTRANVVADAEVKTASGTPELTEMKDRLISRGKVKGPERETRAATAELVRKIFNKEWFVSERAFRALKRGR